MNDEIPNVTLSSEIVSDWLEKEAERTRLHAQLITANKRVLFEAMIAAGISRVEVSFDGYGDSGQIESMTAKAVDAVVDLPARDVTIARAPWGKAKPEMATSSLSEALETIVYDILEANQGGWEDNAGAFGDFVFDVATQSITLDFNERFDSSEYTQYVF